MNTLQKTLLPAMACILAILGSTPPATALFDGEPTPIPSNSRPVAGGEATADPTAPIPYRYPDPVDRQAREWEAAAIAALDTGDWAEVIRATTLALHRNGEALSAWINRGLAYWHLGETGKALADWNRAVALAPANGEARFDRGLAWRVTGREEQAEADLSIACRHGIRQACLAIGNMLGAMSVAELLDATVDAFARRDYQEVIRLSDTVLARDPANPVALTNRCGALVSLGRPDEAMASCEQAMDIAPDFGLAYNNFGAAWERKGDLVSAHAYYELACRRHTPLGCTNRDRLSAPAAGRADETRDR